MISFSMKKAAALVLSFAVIASMSACGTSSSSVQSQDASATDTNEILVLKADEPLNINSKELSYTVIADEADANGEQGEAYLRYGDNSSDLGYADVGRDCDSYVVVTGDNDFIVYATLPDYEWRYTVPVVYKDGIPTVYESVSGSIDSTDDITSADRCLLHTYMSVLGTYGVVIAYNMGENGLVPESSYVQIINENQVDDGSYKTDDSYSAAFDSNGRRILTLKTGLTLSTDRGDVSLPAGTIVYPTGFDTASKQFYVQYDGGEGWFNYTDSSKGWGSAIDGIDENDCFESLFYAG